MRVPFVWSQAEGALTPGFYRQKRPSPLDPSEQRFMPWAVGGGTFPQAPLEPEVRHDARLQADGVAGDLGLLPEPLVHDQPRGALGDRKRW